jgi:hypothetical protein
VLRARSRAAGVSPWTFVMTTAVSTAVASVLTAVIALGVISQDRPGDGAQAAVPTVAAPMPASAPSLPLVAMSREPALAPATFRQISLRTVGSPDEPLRLEPRRPAPLSLQIEPDNAADDPFILAIADAPAGTVLSGAKQIGSDTWFLPPGGAGRLEIELPEWSASMFTMTIVLRRTDGVVAAQTRAWIIVPPPAEAAPGPANASAAAQISPKAFWRQLTA